MMKDGFSEIDSALFIKWLSIAGVISFFWPVILYMILAFASASGWLFWLITSLVFGILQLFYVVYQFWMISVDIFLLSVLKTFAMLRSRLLYYGAHSGLMRSSQEGRRKKRRDWKRRLYAANSLKDYTQIEILDADDPKEATDELNSLDQTKSVSRSQSCNNLSSAKNKLSHSNKKIQNLDKKNTLHHSKSSITLHDVRSGTTTMLNSNSVTQQHETYETQSSSHFDDPDGEVEYRLLVKKQLGVTGGMLMATTERLREARLQAEVEGDISSLRFLLSGVVKRNHLSVDNFLLDDARSVDSLGQYALPKEGKEVIHGYMDEVESCLNYISDMKTNQISETPSKSSVTEDTRRIITDLNERMKLLHKLKQNTGSTALMLSGGGAQAMYHAGTIKALIESDLYSKFTVISGTSGGSIIAAMCALKTPKELLEDALVPHVATDYMRTGEMKKKNIRWFPPLMEMGAYWMKNKLLVDSKYFKKCCDFYYGDVTFEEAFQHTGKHVCITVSASRVDSGGGGAQRLLLNHISTPHVTLSSAVGASCALPGVMAPAKLMTKDSDGNLEPFEVDGVEWIDGSVQADLPFRRISTLFNISEFIVCQCNFHVVPFLNKAHHPNKRSLYWRVFQTCEWDIRNRALNLSRLGLFPKIFGQDISKVFKQKYHGNLTLVPRFTKKQVFGLQALSNPTVEDMKVYLKYGQIAAFPYLSVMKHMLRLETTIDACINRIEARLESITSDDISLDGSAVSSMSLGIFRRPSFYGTGKDTEKLERKNEKLEKENLALKRKVALLEKTMGLNLHEEEGDDSAGAAIVMGEEKKDNGGGTITPPSPISQSSGDQQIWQGLRHRRGTIPPDIPFVELKSSM